MLLVTLANSDDYRTHLGAGLIRESNRQTRLRVIERQDARSSNIESIILSNPESKFYGLSACSADASRDPASPMDLRRYLVSSNISCGKN